MVAPSRLYLTMCKKNFKSDNFAFTKIFRRKPPKLKKWPFLSPSAFLNNFLLIFLILECPDFFICYSPICPLCSHQISKRSDNFAFSKKFQILKWCGKKSQFLGPYGRYGHRFGLKFIWVLHLGYI